MNTIKLGDVVVDTVTNYRGTVTALLQTLHGSEQALVECQHIEGNILENWIAVGRLEAAPASPA